MTNNEITLFGETTFRNKHIKFGIKTDDRRRHMYLIGKTGMGKSTILENMIIEDIRAGHGVAIVDPHGDLAEKVIEYIPNNRVNDVVYFNPADIDFPIAFNVVEHVDSHLRHLVASGLLGVFQKLWADSWGPRLEYILRNAILAVLDYPGSTLLAVTRMLSDKAFRKKVIEKIEDPVVKAFWVNEFAGYADKFASEAVSPIQNKVGQFLSSSLIRTIVGQVKSSIDMRKLMDEGKILILNLSKGRIGEDNSALLGAMMITKIQLAAMSRVDMEESNRKDFYLYVDEFQNFATESFANILSEARKYRLNLILAHQYIEQLVEPVKFAVFGNVGTIIMFRVGAADAEALEPEFAPTFTQEDILNMPKYEIYLKLMIDGIASEPFSARGLPPLSVEEKTGNTEKVINVTRERYARSREIVQEKIIRWHNNEVEDEEPTPVVPAPPSKAKIIPSNRKPLTESSAADSLIPATLTKPPTPLRASTPPRPVAVAAPQRAQAVTGTPSAPSSNNALHETSCSRCGKDTKITFIPDGVRPVYCKDCLSLVRKSKMNEVDERRKAKQVELKNLEKAEAAEPPKQAAVSLKEALSMNPVIFSKAKKPTTPSHPVPSTTAEPRRAPQVDRPTEQARPVPPRASVPTPTPVRPAPVSREPRLRLADESELAEGQVIELN